MTLTTGWKAYFAGGALMVYAVAGYFTGHLTEDQAFTAFATGLGIVGVRHAIA